MPRNAAFDYSSDPNFVEYYARTSLSPQTIDRFTRIRDRALRLFADAVGAAEALDVLDIGCGTGTQAILWAELGHSVTGVDISGPLVELAIRRAQERNFVIRFAIGSATALPISDASVDVVLLPELLEHVVDWKSALREAVRVLRPSGLLYLSTTNRLCPRQQEFTLTGYSWYPKWLKDWCVQRALSTHPHWANYARYPAVNWFSYFELAGLLRQRGFRTLDRFDMLARHPLGKLSAAAVSVIRAVSSLRVLAHMASEGTTLWALRN